MPFFDNEQTRASIDRKRAIACVYWVRGSDCESVTKSVAVSGLRQIVRDLLQDADQHLMKDGRLRMLKLPPDSHKIEGGIAKVRVAIPASGMQERLRI